MLGSPTDALYWSLGKGGGDMAYWLVSMGSIPWDGAVLGLF